MPKEKTHKGLAKRVKVTARGKIKRMRAGAGHLLSHKSSKTRRRLKKATLIKGVYQETNKRELLG
jgi:large subunit ribosomal protein L35